MVLAKVGDLDAIQKTSLGLRQTIFRTRRTLKDCRFGRAKP